MWQGCRPLKPNGNAPLRYDFKYAYPFLRNQILKRKAHCAFQVSFKERHGPLTFYVLKTRLYFDALDIPNVSKFGPKDVHLAVFRTLEPFSKFLSESFGK